MKAPQQLRDMAGLMSIALMGVINRNRYDLIQEVDEGRDAHVTNRIEFRPYDEMMVSVRQWIRTNMKIYDVIGCSFENGDRELTMLMFEIDGEHWKVPLIISQHTNGNPFNKHFNEITVWINTYVAERT